jgi:hypothetical protein
LQLLKRLYYTDRIIRTVRTIGWEGMDFEAACCTQIEVDFLVFSVGEEGSFLLLFVQLLFGTNFEVLKEGKSIQQYGFSGHKNRDINLGLLGVVSYFSWL